MALNSGSSCLHFPNAGSLLASTTIPSRTLFLKIIKKGTNKLKNKQKNQTNQPTTLQRMVTPTFPRQLLEVEIPFYRKLYFSEQSKRRGQHTSCQPTWAPLSYQLWERLDSTPKSDVELVKAQDTPNCWQSSAMSTHAANRKGDGPRVNIPKQST